MHDNNQNRHVKMVFLQGGKGRVDIRKKKWLVNRYRFTNFSAYRAGKSHVITIARAKSAAGARITLVMEVMEDFFSVGERFSSYTELEEKIRTYEQQTFCQLWKRDSRTIESAQKRLNRHLAENIKYYEVTFGCIHGGRRFKCRGEGKRASS